MKERKGRFGTFYGCTGYPICRHTIKMRDVELEIEAQYDNHDEGDTYDNL